MKIQFPVLKKNNTSRWKTQLVQAREHLWKRDLRAAAHKFTILASRLEKERPKKLDDELLLLRLHANLGVWAVHYLQKQAPCGGYKACIQNTQIDDRAWLFIARVFNMEQDIQPDALVAYRQLLRIKPNETNATVIIGLLARAPCSDPAIALLELAVTLLPANTVALSQLCRWYLQADRPRQAAEAAARLLIKAPNDPFSHRCLGYLAELRNDWTSAIKHYEASAEWLRLGVVYNKSGQYEKARQALERTHSTHRRDVYWRYQIGWTYFKANNFESALSYWNRIPELKPAIPIEIEKAIAAARLKADYHRLQSLKDLDNLSSGSDLHPDYRIDVNLRKGAVKLFLEFDPQRAEPLLRESAQMQTKDPLFVSLYLACKAAQRPDLDVSYYKLLAKNYGKAGLYLWLRGLYLAHNDPVRAYKFLNRAATDGVDPVNLPPQAFSSVLWLVARLARSLPDQPTFGPSTPIDCNPEPRQLVSTFHRAVACSWAFERLNAGDIQIPWMKQKVEKPGEFPVGWQLVQTIGLALANDYLAAIDSSTDPQLKQLILLPALSQALHQKEWDAAANLIAIGLEDPTHSDFLSQHTVRLQGLLERQLWREGNYSGVVQIFMRKLSASQGDTTLHHCLALAYTRWALQGDYLPNNSSGKERWRFAIGHWAAALSDIEYWKKWSEQRHWARDCIDLADLRNLKTNLLQLLTHHFMIIQESEDHSLHQNDYRYLEAIVEPEMRAAEAMRHLICDANQQGIKLPRELNQFVSPLLVHIYAEEASREVLGAIEKIKLNTLTTEEAELLRLALSPLGEIRALVESQQYVKALEQLNKLAHTDMPATILRDETLRSYERYIQELIRCGEWDLATEKASEALKLYHGHPDLEMLYVEGVVGRANVISEANGFGASVNYIKQATSTLTKPNAELNALLAEVLTKWAYEAIEDENRHLAQERIVDALKLDNANPKARYLMSVIYKQNSIEQVEANNWKGAYDSIQIAFQYDQGPDTIRMVAIASAQYALQFYNRHQYKQAIEILEKAFQLPYDPNDINLAELLSGVYTDWGVQMFNSGNIYLGRELTKIALKYDPSNQAARDNLRISGW